MSFARDIIKELSEDFNEQVDPKNLSDRSSRNKVQKDIFKEVDKVKPPSGVVREDLKKGLVPAFQSQDKKKLEKFRSDLAKKLESKFKDFKVTISQKGAPKIDSPEAFIDLSGIIDRKADDPDDEVDEDTFEFKVSLLGGTK